MIGAQSHECWREVAIDQAQSAFGKGEFPVGCVIVENDRVIASGSRSGTGSCRVKPSEIDHAEIRALRNLEATEREFDPGATVLYCTMEPCLMCFAAIILSGIKTVVYAFEDPMGGGTRMAWDSAAPLYRDADVTVIADVLRSRSLDLFKKFFKRPENQYWKNSLLEAYTLEQSSLFEN